MNGRIKLSQKKMKFELTVEQYYVETKKDEGPTNGRIGIRLKKRLNKKDVCLINGRLGFGQKNGQKQKSLHPSQL